MNAVSKIYESALKIENENKNKNMSQMQTAGRKERSAVDNLIILNSITENQRQYKKKTYIFFADPKKCFDKLWLKDCLIEMYNLGYSPGTIRSLYEINKTSNIVVDTPVGKTSSITVEEVVKQGTIFGPIMCCASTSRVNEIQEAVKYQYGKVEIGMPVFMDDIAAVGTADNIRKGMQNCRRIQIEKKMVYGLKKTKYMVIKGTALKRIFNLPVSTYIGLIMETGMWPANQRIQYSIMMLYHNIMISDHKRVARKIIAEQAKSDHKNTMISKVKQIAQEIGLKLKNVENMSKSK